MAIQFQHDYRLLELDPVADWAKANKNYRRLVHIWHPDRYAQRPRERVHAQTQFIELTKAFNNLRGFYRENSRMPFEQIKQSVADSPEPPVNQRIKPEDTAVAESSILNKRKPSTKSLTSSLIKPLLWIIPTCAVVIGGIAVFAIIDRNAKLNTIEEAKRVLRSVKPSEYMADSEKITKANRRINLVSGSATDGKMGDKLAKDLFK